MLKIKNVQEVFDWRNINNGLEDLRKQRIDIDYNVEFHKNDKRFRLVRSRIRVMIDTTTMEVMDEMLLMDDGIVTREHAIKEEEKEYIKLYTKDNLNFIINNWLSE